MPMKDNILVLCHSNMHRSPFVAEFIRNSPYRDSYEVRARDCTLTRSSACPNPFSGPSRPSPRGA